MKFFSQSLIALFIAGLLLTGCGKKEEPAAESTVIEQSLQEADQAVEEALQYSAEEAEEAKAEAEDAIEAARKAAGN